MDKDLKKEKEELRTLLFNKIDSVKKDSDLKAIAEKVDALNDKLDIHDSRLANFFDNISAHLSTLKGKIRKQVNDILDNYDKVKKDKTPVYRNEEKTAIAQLIQDIDDICNRNFFDRFKIILGIGT